MAEVDVGDPPRSQSRGFSRRRSSLELSNNVHRRFSTVADYVSELGGSKARVIEKVLIANNGVAAVKAIRSIRRWAYEIFGYDRAIKFVVMATPEDLRANAEYIRMADVIVDVPGGSNNHNYANVTLIVELARLHGVHAVWAGWGHASENPALPNALSQSYPPIKFIGPDGPPMQALGDKIGSTIIAQSANVPCIAWNGSHVHATYDKETGSLPEKAFDEACIHSASAAEEAAAKIGFPIMIKASEGGGGKGIRRVEKQEDVANAYRQVCGEVPGSPIFIMKLSSNSRHLEVQVLADEYGNAVALNGRDCSVQRRHQKIIEEGPPIAAKPSVWKEMENAAISLAKAVHYANAGTVEYLYSEKDAKFYFLELNPRLQVEHPVTEMITRVNLPAAQLQVAMGIPLHNIPDIRELYGRNRFEDDPKSPLSVIDFENTERVEPHGHCIAVRITAENAEAGFKPTSGGIQELNFRSTPNVWGYFSMDSSGSIHEFADSQFGHLFASGQDREQARRNMVLALKELSIRGDISTTVDYISKLIELEDFVTNNIDTAWLDGIIKKVDGLGGAFEGVLRDGRASVKIDTLHDHVYVVLGATIVAFDTCNEVEKRFLDLLEKGQLPPRSLLKMVQEVELILNGVKYKLVCTRKGPSTIAISIKDDEMKSVVTSVRLLSDGGYLIDSGGNSRVTYLTNKGDAASGMRLNVGGASISFSPDYDPTALRTDVAGKLVKKLKEDGAHVKKGEPYCEIEVMKMFMPLRVEESGILTWKINEGASLSAGDLLATLELDNPENVAAVSVFAGDLVVPGWGLFSDTFSSSRPHLMMRAALDILNGCMAGYVITSDDADRAMSDLAYAVTQPLLPVYEVQEQLSVLTGRIPPNLFAAISDSLKEFKKACDDQLGSEVQARFPAENILSLINRYGDSLTESSQKTAYFALTSPLRESVVPYNKSKLPGLPGSERAFQSFLNILRKWIAVERWFCDGKTFADAVDGLRKTYKSDLSTVLAICRSHEQFKRTSDIIIRIISAIAEGFRVDLESTTASAMGKRVSVVAGAESLPDAMAPIAEIGSLGPSDSYSEVSLCARKLIYQESMPSLEQRKQRVLQIVRFLSDDGESRVSRNVEDFFAEHIPVVDIFFPLLKASQSNSEEVGLLELYQRHLYRMYTLRSIERSHAERLVKFSFLNKPSESALASGTTLTSMTELTRIVSSGSLSMQSESSANSGPDSSSFESQDKEKISQNTLRTGVSVIIEKLSDFLEPRTLDSVMSKFPSYTGEEASNESGPVNVLYIVVLEAFSGLDESSSDELAKKCQEILGSHVDMLNRAGIRRASFVFAHENEDEFEGGAPALFTYRFPNFKEDSLYRKIDPSLAMHLELNRVAGNFRVKSVGSRHTSVCHVHLYEGTPKADALRKDRHANKKPRLFARALSLVLDFSSSSYERILVDSLNAFDLHTSISKNDNHLFLNLVSDVEQAVLDPVVVEEVVVAILKRHSDRIQSLGIVEVETRIVSCLSKGSPPIAIRLFASNPTGYVHVMNTYVEAAHECGGECVFKLIGGTKASLASAGDSSWDGFNVNTPYPLTRPFDVQRKSALQASDTLYCYDLPALFEAAVEQQWLEASLKGGIEGGIRGASRPLMVMYTTELVVQKQSGSSSDTWTMEDYLNDDLELIQMNRKAGMNDVGMVAWLVVLKTVEYPNGRQVVLIANDITYKAGSFGTREDVVFKLASQYARENGIPRLFIAANSGARIGLADRVKSRFRVAFKDKGKPESGFSFFFVNKEDYAELIRYGEIRAEPTMVDDEEVFRITDIIGIEPDLGVENLKGSGLIAGETSTAYDEIFTMTVVLGRTVGIGAYLVRLGQRTIQKATASPIILTGYQALNKLMGVDVYSTNDQLGGPGIMYPNGVSHLIAHDHLQAVKSAIDWLSYVPSVRGGLLPIIDIRGLDEIERPIEFTPKPGIPYDPRTLLTGGETDDGSWQSGFFDKGSFTETLAGWAKTVVVGRARLGGIPMGVVITENRTAEAVKPADPADVTASEAVVQEAGCVWFPNSAYKTAQAIKDFRTEDLPLIVFANWRGFSGGQRDMFDEVLKYGSLIVDAFVSYEQPVFVFIPPFAEIRGGAWVVLDASINASVMEMYAAKGTARGGVLEANGAASVKYRSKDILATMHRLDDTLVSLDKRLSSSSNESERQEIEKEIVSREQVLFPVYEQIAVQFCELHDTPGRMKAVGVINREVEWVEARSFFYWRLRRKLAEFDLRKKLIAAAEVGRGIKSLDPIEATGMIKQWFLEAENMDETSWDDDKVFLSWMAGSHEILEAKVLSFTKEVVIQEVVQVMTAGGNTARVGTHGIVEGLERAMDLMAPDERNKVKAMIVDIMRKF